MALDVKVKVKVKVVKVIFVTSETIRVCGGGLSPLPFVDAELPTSLSTDRCVSSILDL